MNYFFLFYNYCFCRHAIAINVAVWRCGGVADEGRGGNLCLVHQISIKALFFLYNCWQFNKNHVHLQ